MLSEIKLRVAVNPKTKHEIEVLLPVVKELCPGLVVAGCEGSYAGEEIDGFEIIHVRSRLSLINGSSEFKDRVEGFGEAFAALPVDYTDDLQGWSKESLGLIKVLVLAYERGVLPEEISITKV